MRITDQQRAVEDIGTIVRRTETPGVAPFAVVVGAGFSHGLVPTAREIVAEHLPAWIDDRENYRALVQARGSKLAEVASKFWHRFSKINKLDRVLQLDLRTGVPTNYVAAYQAAFNPEYRQAFATSRDARAFQRALIRVDTTRLNAAHFLLASILAAQPGRTRPGPLFYSKAAFSRLIVTTNFDPFLQVALQRVNQLYLMHDTPHLGIDADFAGDETDAIQIVYLHGSIHRRSQTATEAEITELKTLNSGPLAHAFRSRGVIVLGYAGWDDGIVKALIDSQRLECGLFWCGREHDPLAPGALPRDVLNLLNRRDCAYVRIRSAGAFMAALSAQLTRSPPLLLDRPLEPLLANLRALQLDDLAQLDNVDPRGAGSPIWRPPMQGDVFEEARQETLNRLTEAERLFQSATLFNARLAEKLGHLDEAIERCTRALASGSPLVDAVPILMLRAHARWASSLYSLAADDFETLLEPDRLTLEEQVEVLFNLAATRRDGGEYALSLEVLQRVVNGSFSTDSIARARYMRDRPPPRSPVAPRPRANAAR
jgi:hypothetical protein